MKGKAEGNRLSGKGLLMNEVGSFSLTVTCDLHQAPYGRSISVLQPSCNNGKEAPAVPVPPCPAAVDVAAV